MLLSRCLYFCSTKTWLAGCLIEASAASLTAASVGSVALAVVIETNALAGHEGEPRYYVSLD